MASNVWVPTHIRLRCNVTRNEKIFWKGTEAIVLSTQPTSITVKLEEKKVSLKRCEYEILSRRRLNNGKG